MTEVINWVKIIADAYGIPEPLLGYCMCALGFIGLVWVWNQEKTAKGNI